jgi:transposase
MLETLGETGVQGAMLKLASDAAFHHWHAFEDGEIDRLELIRKMKPIREEIELRLTRIRDGSEQDFTKKARGTARDMLRLNYAMWAYVNHEGLSPTNNEAERAIRMAVLWRKGSFGANSEAGCRFVERMLTITGTARRRGLNVLDWLRQAIQAELNGEPLSTFS